MLYIHEEDLLELGVSWPQTILVVREAIQLLESGQYHQPIKPYLRFNNQENRIIAMPAYIGGKFVSAGIKWIASFPQNIRHGLPRAHSVTILNDACNGKPYCIINTALISIIRTASVSGFIVNEYIQARKSTSAICMGILGFGPIGQMHLSMMVSLLQNKLDRVFIYDIKQVDTTKIPGHILERVTICDSWQEIYQHADILITATVAQNGYINSSPKPGSLILNVSLRDFEPQIMHYVAVMIVDNWDEVCRQNTDVEHMHKTLGLQKSDVCEVTDFARLNPLAGLKDDDVVMFNPMGMAVFDIAIGKYYYEAALKNGVGTSLKD